MEYTQDWELYQQGIEYKNKINLFKTVDRNERFYSDHYWDGVDTGGMPQVGFPLTRRICNWKISNIMSDMMTMQYSAENAANFNPKNPKQIQQLQEIAKLLSDYSKTTWERLKQDSLNEQALIDACLSGDGIAYFYWDDEIDAGNGVKGDIAEELIDNVCYFPGDTTEPRVNARNKPIQPYIILAFRKLVSEVKKEAEYYAMQEDPILNNGLTREEIDSIASDTETQYRAGDRAKQESSQDKSGGYCTVLLKMWPKDGTIWARKSTQNVVIRKDYDTGLHIYPVALMNWLPRKNSCHGEAEATGLVPNNIAINKQMATMVLWTMLMAYPKPIYDSTRIEAWSNDITKAIPVAGDVTGTATYLQSQGLPASVPNLFEMLVQTTKEMSGANETALGDNSITKTAAGILALTKNSQMPLAMNKRRFAQWIEDIGLIWLDFWLTKYTVPRYLTITDPKEGIKQVLFDGSLYNQATFSLKIDVGASTQWSEVASIQTLDQLLDKQYISFKQWLERVRKYGIVPDAQELIDDMDMQEQQAQMQQQIAAFDQFIDRLSPELQAAIQQEARMMIGGGNNAMPGMQSTIDGGQQQI